jgi:8-oxo-dGTP diphosphatase
MKRKGSFSFRYKKKSENRTILLMHPQSVAGVLFSPDRTAVLLIKRRDVPIWVLPGGGIDANEPPQHAVEREILEETGFTVKASRLVGNYTPICRLAKQTHLYECTLVSGTATLSAETSGVAFFPLDKLPPMPPPYPEWIADALKHGAPIQRVLTSVNYPTLLRYMASHPLLVLRFLLARLGMPINR